MYILGCVYYAYYYLFLLNVWCGPLAESMQTNTVLIVQKTSKGDVSGNTAYTPPGSTCITSTGGKITVRSTAPGHSPWLPILPCLPFIPCFHLIVDCREVAVRSCLPALLLLTALYVYLQSSCYRPVPIALGVPYSFLSSCIQYRAQLSTRVHQALVPALPTY